MYDKYVARADKDIQRMNLKLLRGLKSSNSVIVDQWGLLLVELAACRHTTKFPKMWINSFIVVNLHPFHQIPFKDWCIHIEPFMKAADGFDLITQNNNNLNEYSLIPDTRDLAGDVRGR